MLTHTGRTYRRGSPHPYRCERRHCEAPATHAKHAARMAPAVSSWLSRMGIRGRNCPPKLTLLCTHHANTNPRRPE